MIVDGILHNIKDHNGYCGAHFQFYFLYTRKMYLFRPHVNGTSVCRDCDTDSGNCLCLLWSHQVISNLGLREGAVAPRLPSLLSCGIPGEWESVRGVMLGVDGIWISSRGSRCFLNSLPSKARCSGLGAPARCLCFLCQPHPPTCSRCTALKPLCPASALASCLFLQEKAHVSSWTPSSWLGVFQSLSCCFFQIT